jgi:hypothetical protein
LRRDKFATPCPHRLAISGASWRSIFDDSQLVQVQQHRSGFLINLGSKLLLNSLNEHLGVAALATRYRRQRRKTQNVIESKPQELSTAQAASDSCSLTFGTVGEVFKAAPRGMA